MSFSKNIPLFLAKLSSAIVVSLFLYILLSTSKGIVKSYDPIQFMDQWDCIDSYHNYKDSNIPLKNWFFAKHNEHRIALPRLEALIDYNFGLTNVFLLSVIWISQMTHLFLLWILFRDLLNPPRWVSFALFAFTGCFLFSSIQMENFTWGFQVQFVQVYLFATLSFLLLGRSKWYTEKRKPVLGWLCFFTAILAALLSTFSMANGLIVMVILCLQSLLMRFSWKSTGLLASLSIILFYLYLQVKLPEDQLSSSISLDLNAGFFLFKFIGVYLSLPLAKFSSDISTTIWVSGCGLTILAGAMLFQFLRRKEASRTSFTLISILLFCIATAAATALGRQELSLLQATADRYSTASLIFWPTLIIYLFDVSRLFRSKLTSILTQSLTVAVAFSALVLLVFSQPRYPHFFEQLVYKKNIARLSIRAGLLDDSFLKSVHPDYPRLLKTFERLKKNPKLQKVYGSNLGFIRIQEKNVHSSTAIQKGYLTELPSINKTGGYSCYGTAENFPIGLHRSFEILSSKGKVVGEGMVVPNETIPSNDVADQGSSDAIAWYGYVVGKQLANESFYLFFGNHVPLTMIDPALLHFNHGNTVEFPDRIKALKIEIDHENTQWVKDGKHPVAPEIGHALKSYGSWRDSDANVGQLQMQITIPHPTKTIYIPYLTGPSSPGTQLLIKDQNGKSLQKPVDFPSNTQEWKAFEIVFENPISGKILITANETGAKWGQWTSIGQPFIIP